MFTDGTLIICLGINILLCGLIMYYCKRKFNSYDHKLQSMMELISALTELTEEEMAKEPSTPAPNLKTFTINETVASHAGANHTGASHTVGNDTDVNHTVGPQATTSWTDKASSINESHNPYKDLQSLVNISDNFNQSDDSLSDSDSDSDNDSYNDNDNDNDNDSDNDNDNDSDIELDTLEIPIANNETIKLVALDEDNKQEPINYDKLTVLELRGIVKDKNLSTHPTRLKRNELLTLLQ